MKANSHIILLSIGLLMSPMAFGQQTRQTNLYRHNMYSLNPAYAGYSGCTELNFNHVNQWVKIDGAPVTNFFSGNTRLGKSLGIGANVLVDKLGMFQQVSASGSVSYGITIAREHTIRLGISGGYFQMRLDPSDAIAFDAGDNIIQGGSQSSNSVETEAGLLYAWKGLEFSVSTKQLIETRTNFTYPQLDGYGLRRHYMGYLGYNFLLNKNVSLTPSVLYKNVANVNQLDFNVDVNYNDFIYAGVAYRMEVGLVARVGVNIRKMFYIGYAYETPMQNVVKYSSGSHEIGLGIKLCRKKKEDITDVDPMHADTVRVVETIMDTLIVEKVDTVYIEKPSNDDVRQAMLRASDHLEFEHDKAIILKESYGDLESLTNLLLIREELRISLEGHTDSDGTEEYNMRLSRDRVEAVKAFFVANGVDPSRIKTAYFGESRPVADNTTEEGKARNRRVDMEILNP